jgi:hypothetical protein
MRIIMQRTLKTTWMESAITALAFGLLAGAIIAIGWYEAIL